MEEKKEFVVKMMFCESEVFEKVIEQLRKRGVKAQYTETNYGRKVCRIPVNDLEKLPFDEERGIRYLPETDDAGWELYNYDEALWGLESAVWTDVLV